MSKLSDQVEEMLIALQLEPRKAWQGEVLIPAPGRCAGSYGCGGTKAPAPSTSASDKDQDVIGELSDLVAAGVQVEHASAALARKYEDDPELYDGLLQLIAVMHNPNSKKEDFAKAASGLAPKGSRTDSRKITAAIEKGWFDQL